MEVVGDYQVTTHWPELLERVNALQLPNMVFP